MGFASESAAYISAAYSSAGPSGGIGFNVLFFKLRAAYAPVVFESADGTDKETFYRQSFSAEVDLSRGI